MRTGVYGIRSWRNVLLSQQCSIVPRTLQKLSGIPPFLPKTKKQGL